MRYYPLFLDLSRKDILVVGAGDVGRRKIASLLEAAPRSLCVVDPAPLPDLPRHPRLFHIQGAFGPEQVAGKILVFAATPLSEVNAMVAAVCEASGILCNIADAPEKSDFFVPALARSGGITLAISTGGASPALARRIRADLESWLGNRYTALAVLMGRLRPSVLALALPGAQNAALFRALVHSSLADHLRSGNRAAARELLEHLLPQDLRHLVEELLHDL